MTRLKPDVAFNALHGPYGEDGIIQGVLELLRIPYTHSGVLASSLAMNKAQAKVVAAAAGVSVATGLVASRFEVARKHLLPPPYVAKLLPTARPSASSSSRKAARIRRRS